MKRTDRSDMWPAWLQALAPDPLSRERVRRRVMNQAAGLLRARRAGNWLAITDRWTTALLPLAAALALVFAGLARQASQLSTSTQTPPTVEELLESANPDGPPAVLTSATEPGLDQLLSAAVTPDAP